MGARVRCRSVVVSKMRMPEAPSVRSASQSVPSGASSIAESYCSLSNIRRVTTPRLGSNATSSLRSESSRSSA